MNYFKLECIVHIIHLYVSISGLSFKSLACFYVYNHLKKDLFLERGRREKEKHQCVVASRAPLLGTWATTQACALTGN